MSWEQYVDSLTATGNLNMGAVAGLDGNVWAQSRELNLTPAELSNICKGFTSGWSHAQQGGLSLGGSKYKFLTGDDLQAQCKNGPAGVSISKANTCVVIGVYKEGMQPGNARNSVEKIAQYLQGQNF